MNKRRLTPRALTVLDFVFCVLVRPLALEQIAARISQARKKIKAVKALAEFRW